MECRFLLFDIDGTILKDPIGQICFEKSFSEVVNLDGAFDRYNPHGKTDTQIFKEIIKEKCPESQNTPDIKSKLVDRYCSCLPHHISETHDSAVLFDGIRELLVSLNQVTGINLGLLTGNLAWGARIKLSRWHLNSFFRFGGYGFCEKRSDIVPICLEDADKACNIDLKKPTNENVWIIGDDQRDIESGKHWGCTCVGIATGEYSVSQLQDAGADHVFQDYSDVNAILTTLCEGFPTHKSLTAFPHLDWVEGFWNDMIWSVIEHVDSIPTKLITMTGTVDDAIVVWEDLHASFKRWWLIIQQHYSETHRRYHTLSHIRDLLVLCDKYHSELMNPLAVHLAVFFHDVVYSCARGDSSNEKQSCDLFLKFASEIHLNQQLTNTVAHYISATETHSVSENSVSEDLLIFLDFDMSILAAESQRYVEYASEIREEYSMYSTEQYNQGRAQVLEKFLMTPIYASSLFAKKEQDARKNITNEIKMLRGDHSP